MKINLDHQIKKQEIGDFVVPIQEALVEGLNTDVFPTGFDLIDWALEDEGKGGFRDGDLVVISGKSKT
jgi:hypothetical protein